MKGYQVLVRSLISSKKPGLISTTGTSKKLYSSFARKSSGLAARPGACECFDHFFKSRQGGVHSDESFQ